ncbi:MAG: hypothetical protein ACRELC_06340, partial [Gemmatimonadota bacterium]
PDPVFGVAGGAAEVEDLASDLRPASDRASFQVAFEVGVFSRFFMETEEKDLIGTDFRVGIPRRWRWAIGARASRRVT